MFCFNVSVPLDLVFNISMPLRDGGKEFSNEWHSHDFGLFIDILRTV